MSGVSEALTTSQDLAGTQLNILLGKGVPLFLHDEIHEGLECINRNGGCVWRCRVERHIVNRTDLHLR